MFLGAETTVGDHWPESQVRKGIGCRGRAWGEDVPQFLPHLPRSRAWVNCRVEFLILLRQKRRLLQKVRVLMLIVRREGNLRSDMSASMDCDKEKHIHTFIRVRINLENLRRALHYNAIRASRCRSGRKRAIYGFGLDSEGCRGRGIALLEPSAQLGNVYPIPRQEFAGIRENVAVVEDLQRV